MISKLFGRVGLALLLVLVPVLAVARAKQPAPVSEPLRLSGTLSVQIEDDFEARKSRTVHSLVVRPGYRVPLEFTGAVPAGLRTGMKVWASGRFDGERLRVDPGPGAFRVDAAQSPAAVAPTAARKVLMVLTDIVDGTGSVHHVDQSCDASDKTADIMFGTTTTLRNVDGAYRASSYEALGIGGAAYPGNGLDVLRVQVQESAASLAAVCNYDDWANKADAMVSGAGVAPGDFQHRMYVLPSAAGCGWAGLGELSCGADCRAWVKASEYYCGTRGAHAHELGHNLGLMHASSDWYNDGIGIDEYGDASDFMGYAEDTVHLTNALHQAQLGWLDAVDFPADGTFTLSPTSVDAAAHPRLYRLAPVSGLPYYFSYRMGVGYDDGVAGQPLSIHRWAGGQANTIYITTLYENDSFFDAANGLVVTMLSKSPDGAVFTVTRGGACSRAAPTVGISPASISTTEVPASATYTVTVRNNDSNACGSSPFAVTGSTEPWLQNTGSAGWKRIAPGSSASFNFTVGANAITANGTYAVTVGTTADEWHAAVQANANYIVDVSPECVVRAPTGQMFPASQNVTQLPAIDVGFGANIVNNDSGSSCTESNFPLSVTVPAGWSETHSPSTLSLSAIGSGVSNIHVSVPAGTPNGTYPITVSTTASGSHGAISFSGSVTVAVDPNACYRQAPMVVLNPSTVSTSTLPKSWSVTVSVQNRDSGDGCAPSTFSLATYSEAGWAMSVSPSSLSVGPGATATSTMNVTAPTGAGVGNYQPMVLVTDAPHDETRAVLLAQVLASSSCMRAAPGVSISPASQTLTALPGSRSYTVSVANKDSSACASSLFPLAASVPAGWTGTMTPLRLTLLPGTSATATLVATPAASAANGTYGVGASTKSDTVHPAVSAGAKLVVNVASGSDTTPPTVPGNLTGKLVSGRVVLGWTASTDSGSGLANYKVFRNGVLFATTTVPSLTKLVSRGTWKFYVIATDRAGNASGASNTVVVTK